MDDIPLTLNGIRQALYDLRDDYTNHLHDGTSTRTFQTIRAEAASLRALSIQKIGYADDTAGLWTGVSASGVPQFYLGTSSKYIKFDGVNFSILGALSVTQLDIPDQTTASSFHVDSSGNTWWGANVATGYSGANAAILSTGAATFKNVSIGGSAVQYVITNSGIFSYGDGSDGDATCDGSTAVTGMTLSGSTYTMTRDVYFGNLTINSSIIVKPANYRIFCSVSLTVNGTIQANGNDGSGGNNGTGDSSAHAGGSGGTALAAGYFLASSAGGAGGASGAAGVTGGAATNALGSQGATGGGGGYGHDNVSPGGGFGGGSGGTATASSVKLIANWHLATMLDINAAGGTAKFMGNSGPGGGGCGGRQLNQSGAGGSGGGGGGNAGVIAIYAKSITIGAAGAITSTGGTGGTGGNGFNGGSDSGGGGGGGSGGSGGLNVLVYNSLTNSGSITASGGSPGSGGSAGNLTHGSNGSAGSTGTAGVIYQFQLSL